MGVKLDALLVGGGLANGLTALALRARRPDLRIAVLERNPSAGGNHTWSFHAGDVTGEDRQLVDPLVAHRWPGYEVRFPGSERRLAEPYASISSERFAKVLSETLGDGLRVGCEVAEVGPGQVTLASGEVLEAPLIVDARGPEAGPVAAGGYQKFVGVELELAAPVAPVLPLVMDATVEQLDGYRFVYVLPLAPDRILVEDTYYSDSPALAVDTLAARALAWCVAAGLPVVRERRREQGVLAIPAGPAPAEPPFAAAGSNLLVRAGYAAGWFHPTTGYSLPVALRVARTLAETSLGDLPAALTRLWHAQGKQARFARLLNRLLFEHFAPEDRWNVLARFYRLPTSTVRRFYALDTTAGDRLRILCGRPPAKMSWRRLEATS